MGKFDKVIHNTQINKVLIIYSTVLACWEDLKEEGTLDETGKKLNNTVLKTSTS